MQIVRLTKIARLTILEVIRLEVIGVVSEDLSFGKLLPMVTSSVKASVPIPIPALSVRGWRRHAFRLDEPKNGQ